MKEELLKALREGAKGGLDPTCSDGTLALLLETAERIGAKTLLEIGAGEGLTSAAFVLRTGGMVTAIENDPVRISKAKENFMILGINDRISLIEGDAGTVLPRLEKMYDLIFLDGPKVQYRKYLPFCKLLLKGGGVLVADDVFFLGKYIDEVPKKRRMLFTHLEEFRRLLTADEELRTTFYDCGDGVSVSVKL